MKKYSLSLNNKILDLLHSQYKICKSADFIVTEDLENHHTFPLNFLNAETFSGIPPHVLNLKVGSLVTLIRNRNAEKVYVMIHALLLRKRVLISLKPRIKLGAIPMVLRFDS